MTVKTEFIDELGHLESSTKQQRRIESIKNSSNPKSIDVDDQPFGEHFLLEGSGMTGDIVDQDDSMRSDFVDDSSFVDDSNNGDLDNEDDEDGSGTEDLSGKLKYFLFFDLIMVQYYRIDINFVPNQLSLFNC